MPTENKTMELRKLMCRVQWALNGLGSSQYADALLQWMLQCDWLEQSGHPVWDVFLADTSIAQEWDGERTLSTLSQLFQGNPNSHDHEVTRDLYRSIAPHAQLSNDVLAHFNVPKAKKQFHENVQRAKKKERIEMAKFVKGMAKGLLTKNKPSLKVFQITAFEREPVPEDASDSSDDPEEDQTSPAFEVTKKRVGSKARLSTVHEANNFLPDHEFPDVANHMKLVKKRYHQSMHPRRIYNWSVAQLRAQNEMD
jgi:hypothetical protein